MTTSSHDVTIRQIGQEELDRFQQRIVQIFLDAFTTDGFAFNAQRATEAKAVSYLQWLLAQDSVAFFAFDAGKAAYPYYPIGFLFGSPLSSDPLLSQTSIPEAYDLKQCGYIAELAVDLGHRGRGVGHRLIAAYVAYCKECLHSVALARQAVCVQQRDTSVKRGSPSEGTRDRIPSGTTGCLRAAAAALAGRVPAPVLGARPVPRS